MLLQDGNDTTWKRVWLGSVKCGTRYSLWLVPVSALQSISQSQPCGNLKSLKEKKDSSFSIWKSPQFAYLSHLNIDLLLVCICKYTPVSVQISLVPLPLKYMCIVNAWEGIGLAMWSSTLVLAAGSEGMQTCHGSSCRPFHSGIAHSALCQGSRREGRGLTSLFLCMLS